jgi:hypothetical protein
MITKTITWSLFQKDKKTIGFEDLGLTEPKDALFEDYLNNLKSLKKRFHTEGVSDIAIYHTVFYDGQCNTEFSPKIMAILTELNATFCVTAQNNAEQSDLYAMLDKMRERPALYLGATSISLMAAFIDGFKAATNYETSESTSFDGFNDFVGKFYGKYTTAGWKNLILADHFGNEIEALTRFYVLLDEFREAPNKPQSRAILCRFLHLAMLDFRGENDHERQKQIADMLHHVSNQLYTAIYGGISVWYDSILQDVFDRARGNKYLHHWIKSNAPSTVFYEYELWSGHNGKTEITTLIPSNHTVKDAVLDNCEVLIETFFAINDDKAKEIKEAFMLKLNPKKKKTKKGDPSV